MNHMLKNFDIDLCKIKKEAQEKCEIAQKVWRMLWNDYTNNSSFRSFLKGVAKK